MEKATNVSETKTSCLLDLYASFSQWRPSSHMSRASIACSSVDNLSLNLRRAQSVRCVSQQTCPQVFALYTADWTLQRKKVASQCDACRPICQSGDRVVATCFRYRRAHRSAACPDEIFNLLCCILLVIHRIVLLVAPFIPTLHIL
ncbi:hypothetical protein P692DRAFT_20231140 [Suillus brevipes Sb2]|nr:hypothetical protein P692DRAFT_20231140 [Suillus brevipes Sb2]